MRGCKMLKLVRANFGHLENLNRLSVDIDNLKALLESSGQLKCLSELFITDDCKNLERHSHSSDLLSIEDCPNLMQVDITNCESLKVIDVRDLQSLRVFRVRSCPRLRNIMGLISLDGISVLEIQECMSLTDIDIGSSFHAANNIVSESIASATGCWNVLLMPDFHPFKSLLNMCITMNAKLFFQDIDTTEATLSEMSIVSDSRRRSNPKCLFFPLKKSTSLGERHWVIDGVLPQKLKCIGATIFLVFNCAGVHLVKFSIGPARSTYFTCWNETRLTLLHTEIYSNICKDDLNKAYVGDNGGSVRGGWMCVHVIEEELREDEKVNVWGHFTKEIRRHVHTSLSSTTRASCDLPITIDVTSLSAPPRISPVAIMKHILSP